MKLTITKNKHNTLLQRHEVEANLEFTKETPSNAQVTAELAKQLKTEESLVIIKTIATAYAVQTAKVSAVAYENTESKGKYEVMTKHLRKEEEKRAKEEAEQLAAKKEAEVKAKEEAEAAKKAEAVPNEEEKSEGEE
jgi:ribosomal protein S24E